MLSIAGYTDGKEKIKPSILYCNKYPDLPEFRAYLNQAVIMSTISELKPITLSANQKEDLPLFLVGHTVFSGKAPKNYEILGVVQISVFETAAKADLIFTKMPPMTASHLPALNALAVDVPFWGEISTPEISTGSHVTQEQQASLSKWVKDKNVWQFPEVKEISYRVGPEEGVEIGDEDAKDLFELVQKRVALQFPSIKAQATQGVESQKKTN